MSQLSATFHFKIKITQNKTVLVCPILLNFEKEVKN